MQGVFAALAASALIASALANDPGPGDAGAAGRFAGPYTFDGDGLAQSGCTVTLFDSGSYGQFDLAVPDHCRRMFPVFESLSGWSPGERGFRFLSRLGGVAIVFYEIGTGQYLGEHKAEVKGDGRVYRMSFRAPEEVRAAAGRYWMWPADAYDATCVLTLTTEPAGRTATYQALREARCTTRLPVGKLDGWMHAGPGIILLTDTKGGVLGRFEQLEGGEDAMAGTIDGVALKIGKMVE